MMDIDFETLGKRWLVERHPCLTMPLKLGLVRASVRLDLSVGMRPITLKSKDDREAKAAAGRLKGWDDF